jgi:hypothetical protein
MIFNEGTTEVSNPMKSPCSNTTADPFFDFPEVTTPPAGESGSLLPQISGTQISATGTQRPKNVPAVDLASHQPWEFQDPKMEVR